MAQALSADGHDAEFAGDVDPHMPDGDVLDWAVRERRIPITQDHNFGMLVYQSKQDHERKVNRAIGTW